MVVRSGVWVSSRVSGDTLCLAKWSPVDPSSQFPLFGRSTARGRSLINGQEYANKTSHVLISNAHNARKSKSRIT